MRIKSVIAAAALAVGCQGADSGSGLSDSYSMGSLSVSVGATSSVVMTTKSSDEEVVNETLEMGTDTEGNEVMLLPSRLDIVQSDIVLSITGDYIIPDAEAGVQLEGGERADLEFEPMTITEFETEDRYFFASEYQVNMSYGDPTLEALDNPCYSGDVTINIVARKSIDAEVTLSLCNSILYKVVTTEKFNNYYKLDESQFFITTTAGTEREFEVNEEDENGAAESDSALFFVEAGTTLTLSGTTVKSGNDVELTFEGELGVTEAGCCYTIVIDAEDVGSSSILVTFDDDISEFATEEVQSVDMRPDITE
ncbi:MAG: DUF4493 domain-containing protein [Rikenellaceae bacterium]